MDNYVMMILVCAVMGVGMTVASPMLGLYAALMGPIIAVVPGIMLYFALYKTGMLKFISPQKRGEVLVFYATATRRIYPLIGIEGMERFIKIKGGYGRIRVAANSDYSMMGKKVVLARQGTAHTVPMEIAQKTQEMRAAGAKSLKEAKERNL